MKKTLIIIPTYNEIENIPDLLRNINKLQPNADILIVDDNSEDGTGRFIKKIDNEKIFLISRPGKMGIGSAHKDGIKFAYKNNYDFVITMDADGTHDPKYINEMKRFHEEYDLINTNRFLNPNLWMIGQYLELYLQKLDFFKLNSLECFI